MDKAGARTAPFTPVPGREPARFDLRAIFVDGGL
jgi:hypothetical protein